MCEVWFNNLYFGGQFSLFGHKGMSHQKIGPYLWFTGVIFRRGENKEKYKNC